MGSDPDGPLLEVRGIRKVFPGVCALAGVDLVVDRGEVVAVIGENGAGKSTLMKILAGVQRPDGGTLCVDGVPVEFDDVASALRHGIALIHQELNLCDNLSIGANVFLGREPRRRGMIDEAAIVARSAVILQRVGLDVDPRRPLGGLSIGQQQLVEIAKALSTDARVLIMDEPTSSLSQGETERLFAVVHELRRQGVSVIYISHRLGEVRELADRVVVLRDGANAGTLGRAEVTHQRMVSLMVGRDVERFYSRTPHAVGAAVLAARGVRTTAWPAHAVDLDVAAGEIVGIAGLVGAGRSELLRALFGVDRRVAGEVRVGDAVVPPGDARAAIRAGLALVPEDRKLAGLVLDMGVRENLSLASLGARSRHGWIDGRGEAALASDAIERLSIKTPHAEQVVRYLSGGNQQKVVLGKWLALAPQVLLLDEPTRGIDVGAKEEIYHLMHRLAGDGAAILFASSEMEEVMGVADRVLVMHEGRIQGALERSQFSEEAILDLATGGAPRESA